MSYGITQAYLPLCWVGNYILPFGPNNINSSQSNNIANHNILGQQDANEIIGFSARQIDLSGFIASTSTQAILDMYNFTQNQSNYMGRPISWGFYTQDPNNLYHWQSGVGYLNTATFRYNGGYALYKYPYRLSILDAGSAVQIINTATGDGQHYTFTLPTNQSGWIAGIQLLSGGGIVNPLGALTYLIHNSVPTTIGTAPTFFTSNTKFNIATGDTKGVNLSISDATTGYNGTLVASPSGTYTVQFGFAFNVNILQNIYWPVVNVLFIPT